MWAFLNALMTVDATQSSMKKKATSISICAVKREDFVL